MSEPDAQTEATTAPPADPNPPSPVEQPAGPTAAELQAKADAQAAEDRRIAIETANANRVERQKTQADEAAAAEVGPADPTLVGFLAISATAGQRGSKYPGRMVAFPVMPSFGHEQPLKDLIHRINERNPDGSWHAYAVTVDGAGNASIGQLEPAAMVELAAEPAAGSAAG